MSSSRVTMRDVAERAGVSTAAVSYAYTQPGRLTPETLQRIQDSARDLGYVRDWSARALRRGRTDTVGLVLPQSVDDAFENSYYPRFVQGVGRVCRQNGLMLLLVPPADGLSGNTFAEAAADGFIVVGLVSDRMEVASLRARNAPLVLVDSDPIPGVPLVAVDERAAMKTLVAGLIAGGHRRLAVAGIETGQRAGHAAWQGAMRHRMDGVLDALRDAGLPVDADALAVTEVPSTEAGGERAFEQLWAAGPRPSAIVCFSDEIALGVMRAAVELGVAVPDELSVTGFDDLDAARQANPALTTVRQPIVEKGELAARHLVSLLNSEAPEELTVLPATVVHRGSAANISNPVS